MDAIFAFRILTNIEKSMKSLHLSINGIPPYAGMKSVISNFKLSLEQAKEVHYHRGDLPIIAIGASDVPLSGDRPEGFSDQDLIEADRFIHKDLAALSNNNKYVIVNGTAHMSVVHNDETAKHILSIVPEFNDEDLKSTKKAYIANCDETLHKEELPDLIMKTLLTIMICNIVNGN